MLLYLYHVNLIALMMMMMMMARSFVVLLRTSIYGSAVCVYDVSALDRAFSGPYKFQADAQMAWARMPNKDASQLQVISLFSVPS